MTCWFAPLILRLGAHAAWRDIRSGQRAQVAPQAVGAGTRKQALDLAMRASPDRDGARERRPTEATRAEDFGHPAGSLPARNVAISSV